MADQTLEKMRQIRLEKIAKLREFGINPYPSKVNGSPQPVSLALNSMGKNVEAAGRLMSWREHGNVVFADLKDESGQIQLWFQKNNLVDKFKILRYLDVGDFLLAKGDVTQTQAGQTSVNVSDFQLLSKSIRPLPSLWYGLKDEEQRYRKRYLDLLLNDEIKDLFRKKAVFWQSMRNFLIERNFLEVETPVLETTAGGADASPFVTHHDALDTDFYLRISMGELWQKRLMVSGFGKTFEIGRQFRNEGLSREHLQDYSQMEFYWAYANYEDSMKLVEEMYKFVAKECFGTLSFDILGHKVNLAKNWDRIDYKETVLEHTGIDVIKVSKKELTEKLKELGAEFNSKEPRERLIDNLWKVVRKKISGPVFLVGHPVEISPLAKRKEDNPAVVERYQVIIAGSEMGNGYSELNDPVDQAGRFSDQQKLRDGGDDEAQMHDRDFVEALEYGMPPVTGFGVSERLFSFLVDKPVRETVLFPLMRPENSKASVTNNTSEVTGKEPQILKVVPGNFFSISDELRQKYPSISIGIALIKGVNIEKTNNNLEKDKNDLLKLVKGMNNETISSFPEVESYRKLYKEMGIDWHSRRPSPEALLRRVALGKGLYTINTCVDAYNIVVMRNRISVGAFDADKIKFPTELRFAKNGEGILLLGDDEPTKYKDGEVAYFDQIGGYNMDFNYRDSQRTMVTEKTKNVWINVDGVYDATPEKVQQSLDESVEKILKYCGGKLEFSGLVI